MASYREYNRDTYVPYEKPVDLGTWQNLKLTIWDGQKKAFFRRTFKSWVGIISFFLVFYGVLACFYAICMQGLLLTINDKYPTYILDDSLIGSNPGLGFRPISETPDVDGGLIWYKANDEEQCQKWVDRMDTFLEPYLAVQGGGHNQVVCDYDRPPAEDKVCLVDVKNWAPCNAEHGYSYNRSSPCVYLKLNRIYNWEPVFYNNVTDLPEDMPEELQNVIRGSDTSTLNTVWLSCRGENPMDREHIGPIVYYPQQGFPGFYYPYRNTPGYLSPLVAVRFERPKMHVLINVECRAWAKNIIYSHFKGVREGSVHFELLID